MQWFCGSWHERDLMSDSGLSPSPTKRGTAAANRLSTTAGSPRSPSLAHGFEGAAVERIEVRRALDDNIGTALHLTTLSKFMLRDTSCPFSEVAVAVQALPAAGSHRDRAAASRRADQRGVPRARGIRLPGVRHRPVGRTADRRIRRAARPTGKFPKDQFIRSARRKITCAISARYDSYMSRCFPLVRSALIHPDGCGSVGATVVITRSRHSVPVIKLRHQPTTPELARLPVPGSENDEWTEGRRHPGPESAPPAASP